MLIYDIADPTELAGFVRAIVVQEYHLINGVLPGQAIDDIEYRFIRGDLTEMDVAVFRAFDAEANVGTRGGVARISGELPPISKKMRLGEEQRLRLRQLQGQSGGLSALAQAVFDDAARLARSLLGRLELAAGQSIDTGVMTIAENGVSANINYGYSTGANSQTPTAPVLFSTAATADPLGFMQSMVDDWQTRNNGELPGSFLTSKRVRAALLQTTQIKNSLQAAGISPPMVTIPQLGQVLQSFDLPPIRLYDVTVSVGGVTTRTVRDTQLILLPAGAPLGRTYTGVTAEALELQGAGQIAAAQVPGMVVVNDKTFDPVATWTKVAAIALPTIANPLRVTSAKVL